MFHKRPFLKQKAVKEIKFYMEEKYFIGFIGIILVVLNKYFAKGCIWWEKEVVKFGSQLDIWFYRIPCILVGLIFILVSIVKK
jgi:hypothetical protein